MNKHNERVACLSAPESDTQPVLRAVHASGEINGLTLRMRLKQLYRNTSKEELETVYSFPLAWGTTLLDMRVTLNGKEMTGAVIEKKQAEEKYEDAISAGDVPVMLVRESKDIYSARLGNLKPGDEASIEIEYGQVLRVDQGQLRLTVPTTIAPRFGRDPGLYGLMAHALGAVDPLAEHRFHLVLEIRGPLASANIYSPSHAVLQRATDSGTRIELSQRAMLDRDFILGISGLDDLCISTASAEPDGGEGCTLLTSFVPKSSASDAATRPARLKILVDCSGSMAGDGMRLAREGMMHAVRQLLPEDHVSFSCFGSTAVHMHKRMARADQRMINRLMRESQMLEAELGGTELDQALREVIEISGPESDEADTSERSAILLITDGEVWDIDGIVQSVRASGHIIYAIGVGSAPAESLLRELAEVSGGGCELLAPNEGITGAVNRLFGKIRTAMALEVSVEIDGEPLPVASISRRVAPGEMVHLWCQLKHRPAQPPRLRIHTRGAEDLQLIEPSEIHWSRDSAVARIGAAQRLLDMSDEIRRKEIALRYQLVTEQSSFFLIHERAALDKASGVPELRQVGNMMAAGWGGAGTVFASVQMDIDPLFARPNRKLLYRSAPSTAPLRSPAVWRKESGGGIRNGTLGTGPRKYSSLAQALANPDEPDNPLLLLINELLRADGGADVLDRILALIRTSSSLELMREVLDELAVIVGSEEVALAVLLEWTNHLGNIAQASRRSMRPVNAALSNVAPEIREDAYAFLEAKADKRHDPLPVGHEVFDISAFLRRQAD